MVIGPEGMKMKEVKVKGIVVIICLDTNIFLFLLSIFS